jgi:hypothetical protein
MSQNVYYHATLCLHAPFVVTEDKKKGGVKVTLGIGDRQFPLTVKKKWAATLSEKSPQGDQGVILWPRTDKEGLLGSGTQLALFKPISELDREPGLHALGELVKVDKENALLQIQIHPNPDQGSLKKSFKLPLVANLELLESLPDLGSGLEVWADLKPKTGRMVVNRVQAVPLPPKRAVEENSTPATLA